MPAKEKINKIQTTSQLRARGERRAQTLGNSLRNIFIGV